MEIKLHSYDIPKRFVENLERSGYSSHNDVTNNLPERIASDTSLIPAEIELVSTAVTIGPGQRRSTLVNCLHQLTIEKSRRMVKTFSANVNGLLGGGFCSSRVTEVCGLPGTGKTQLCMQLCVSVQLPRSFGGLEADALYVDNEGSFTLERLVDMSESAVRFYQETASRSTDPAVLTEMCSLSVDRILKGVQYLQCVDQLKLIAAVNALPELIASNPKIQLIVVDNAAVHFRNVEGDYSRRNRILHHLFQTLLKLATCHDLTVVITNPMTTRLRLDYPAVVVPALGECWSHLASNRLILQHSKTENKRTMALDKSSYLPRNTVNFDIDCGGIVDPIVVPPAPYMALNKTKHLAEHSSVPAKRVKYD